MIKNVIFSLNGIGYLHDLIRKNDELYGRINVINKFNINAQRTDDVWIDVLIKEDFLPIMNELKSHLNFQRTVILHFSAEYDGFDYCQTGLSDEDPGNMVHIQGKLQCIMDYFIDGISQKSSKLHAHLKLA